MDEPETAGAMAGPRPAWALPACLFLAMALPVAILAALVWVFPRPASGFTPAVHPVGAPVETGTDTGLAAAVATLRWSAAPALRAPAWEGLVTQVTTHPGDTLTTGSPVAVVDGVTRVAVASSAPFYRALSEGDVGPDVTMLRAALTALGLGNYGTKRTFDSRLAAGTARLSARLGGDPHTATFDPAWFVFLPTAEVPVAAVKVQPAQPAPPAGEEVVSLKATLTGLRVTPPSADADGASSSREPASTRFPESGLGYLFAPDSDPTIVLPLDADFTATGSLAKFAAAVSSSDTSVAGTIRAANPRDVSIVPTTALVTGSTGRTCVYPYTASLASLKPLTVDVVGGEPGLTKVAPIAIQQVLTNPAALSGLVPCQ